MSFLKSKKLGYVVFLLGWAFLGASVLLQMYTLGFAYFLKSHFSSTFSEVVDSKLLFAPHVSIIVISWLFIKKGNRWMGMKKGLLVGLYVGAALTILFGFYLLLSTLANPNSQILTDGVVVWMFLLGVFYVGMPVIIAGGIIGIISSLIIRTLRRN